MMELNNESLEEIYTKAVQSVQAELNNGGKTNYYDLPLDAITLDDLIEYKQMSFWRGNIFKTVYALDERANRDSKANEERELNKIIYYANRRLCTLKNQ